MQPSETYKAPHLRDKNFAAFEPASLVDDINARCYADMKHLSEKSASEVCGQDVETATLPPVGFEPPWKQEFQPWKPKITTSDTLPQFDTLLEEINHIAYSGVTGRPASTSDPTPALGRSLSGPEEAAVTTMGGRASRFKPPDETSLAASLSATSERQASSGTSSSGRPSSAGAVREFVPPWSGDVRRPWTVLQKGAARGPAAQPESLEEEVVRVVLEANAHLAAAADEGLAQEEPFATVEGLHPGMRKMDPVQALDKITYEYTPPWQKDELYPPAERQSSSSDEGPRGAAPADLAAKSEPAAGEPSAAAAPDYYTGVTRGLSELITTNFSGKTDGADGKDSAGNVDVLSYLSGVASAGVAGVAHIVQDMVGSAASTDGPVHAGSEDPDISPRGDPPGSPSGACAVSSSGEVQAQAQAAGAGEEGAERAPDLTSHVAAESIAYSMELMPQRPIAPPAAGTVPATSPLKGVMASNANVNSKAAGGVVSDAHNADPNKL